MHDDATLAQNPDFLNFRLSGHVADDLGNLRRFILMHGEARATHDYPGQLGAVIDHLFQQFFPVVLHQYQGKDQHGQGQGNDDIGPDFELQTVSRFNQPVSPFADWGKSAWPVFQALTTQSFRLTPLKALPVRISPGCVFKCPSMASSLAACPVMYCGMALS